MLYALYWVAPEKGSAIKTLKSGHKNILDMFDLYDTPKVGPSALSIKVTTGSISSTGAFGPVR
jgi:hypothetical protein